MDFERDDRRQTGDTLGNESERSMSAQFEALRAENNKPQSNESQGADSQFADSAIGGLLSRLRQRIRRYVAVEGIATAIAWCASLFMLSLALDYLPILFGLTELPRFVRALLMMVLVGGGVYWLVRLVVARWMVPLPDRSLALLVERYHSDFRESLVTTVERPQVEGEVGEAMLSRARSAAASMVEKVDLSRIFDRTRLTQRIVAAGAALAVIGTVGLASPESLSLGARRLLLLDNAPWPRSTRIEVVGVRIISEVANPVLSETDPVQPFVDGTLRAAKGTQMVLLVRAAVANDKEPDLKIPGRCVVTYRTADGDRGFQYMDKVGQPRDGYQWFELSELPFRSVSNDVLFDVRGDDSRITGMKISVVDPPAVVASEVACTFPAYMVDEENDAWTPRSFPLAAGTRVPIGTQAIIKLRTNKPLKKVWAYQPATQQTVVPQFEVQGTEVALSLGALANPVTWEFTFEDQDGVIGENPYRAELLTFADLPPKVKTRLMGIGDAITPEARLPLVGTIEDDFAVARSWLEVRIADREGVIEPLALAQGNLEAALDLREKRQQGDEAYRMDPDTGMTMNLTVAAEDRFDLDGKPNLGQGDAWPLEIVSASQLLRRLERKEAGQRQLVEQIHDELTEAHNLLVRVRGDLPIGIEDETIDESAELGSEPGDELAVDATVAELSRAEANLVFSQRVILQIQKSKQELAAVATTFDDIRLQLINNRVDSEERKVRLEQEVVVPLRQLLDSRFTAASERVEVLRQALEARLRDANAGIDPATEVGPAIEEMQLLLVELNDILERMLKFESYNELLDVVREMIRQQELLLEETEKERKRRAFEDLIR